MTSSGGVQLTAGQKFLIDLLQRKLLNTIQLYAKLSLERQQLLTQSGQRNELSTIERELGKLKEKIRRISARQKRFTLEIINKNGNNTIPKETFFEALGLVTREALNKLNSKTNERRRRTTANPRFSHEAIQAKRAALEHPSSLQSKRSTLESRLSNNNNRDSNLGSRDHSSGTTTGNNSRRESARKAANNNLTNHGRASNNQHRTAIDDYGGKNQQASTINTNNGVRTSNRVNSRNKNLVINNNGVNNNNNNVPRGSASKRKDLLSQLRKQIHLKVSQIKDKREDNRKLLVENEIIRKNGLELLNAINMMNSSDNPISQEAAALFRATNNNYQSLINDATSSANNNNINNSNSNNNININELRLVENPSAEQLDNIWIDMKCDESLDGLD